jgi:transposase
LSQNERKTYTKEFKQEAVRLAEASDLPMSQIARQLGIHRNMLAKWRQELGQPEETSTSLSQEGTGAEEELQKLRQEVQALRLERDILKKALAIISREQA